MPHIQSVHGLLLPQQLHTARALETRCRVPAFGACARKREQLTRNSVPPRRSHSVPATRLCSPYLLPCLHIPKTEIKKIMPLHSKCNVNQTRASRLATAEGLSATFTTHSPQSILLRNLVVLSRLATHKRVAFHTRSDLYFFPHFTPVRLCSQCMTTTPKSQQDPTRRSSISDLQSCERPIAVGSKEISEERVKHFKFWRQRGATYQTFSKHPICQHGRPYTTKFHGVSVSLPTVVKPSFPTATAGLDPRQMFHVCRKISQYHYLVPCTWADLNQGVFGP